MHVTDRERADFQRDGAVCLRGRLDQGWIDALRRGVERNMAEPGPYGELVGAGHSSGKFFADYCNWPEIPEYRDFVLSSPAGAIAGELMGARRAQIFHEHVLVKEPGTSKATPWHHDMPYYCVEGTQTVSLWLALDPIPEAASLAFVAGSHQWGNLFYPRRFEDGSNYAYDDGRYAPVPDIEAEPERYRVLRWAMEPGDLVAFHFLTLHGAAGNTGTHRRRAFSTRWLGDDARYTERPAKTSPPFPGIGLTPGDPMREDWFPVVWSEAADRPA
jgi:ectoine hydroxylase-related dioxygenase (phytanoyl-CoA dioxygenase family)